MKGNGKPKTSVPSPALVPQSHGGALRRGNPGNLGRPPSAARALCRKAFAERVPILMQIADGEIEGDRIRAIDTLGKYGRVAEVALTPEEQPESVLTRERVLVVLAQLEQFRSIENLLPDADADAN